MSAAFPIHFHLKNTDAVEAFAGLVSNDSRFRSVMQEGYAPSGLIMVEVTPDTLDRDLEYIATLASTPGVLEVFILAQAKDPDLILKVMRAGANEFLPLPLRKGEFTAALDRFISRRRPSAGRQVARSMQEEPGKVVLLLGGKSGIGVTTLAVNMAVEAAGMNPVRPAALMDMRMPQGEIPLFLDVDYMYTWAEAAQDVTRIDDDFLQSLMVRHSSGLDLLAAPDRNEEVGSTGPAAITAILRHLRSMYGTVFVDCNPILDDLTVSAISEADAILVLTELSLPCLANTRTVLENIDRIDHEALAKIQLVASRFSEKCGISRQEAEELLEKKLEWLVEDDYTTVLSAINQGQTINAVSPRSPVARTISRMTKALSGSMTAKSKPAGLLGSLFGRSRRKQQIEDDDISLHLLQGAEG